MQRCKEEPTVPKDRGCRGQKLQTYASTIRPCGQRGGLSFAMNLPRRLIVLFIIVVSLASSLQWTTAQDSLIITLTSTRSTTFEITYNYVTTSNGSSSMRGYVTTSVAAIATTITSTLSNMSSASSARERIEGASSLPGFQIEVIFLGLIIGAIAVTFRRRRKTPTTS